MDRLIELAAWVFIESRKANAGATTARISIAVLCSVLALVLTLAALGCAASAIWTFMLPVVGPVGAPLVAAAALLTAALLLAAAAWIIVRRSRRRRGAAVAPHLLLSDALHFFGENKGAMILAEIIAGMAAANGGRDAAR